MRFGRFAERIFRADRNDQVCPFDRFVQLLEFAHA
jgi:hypothetical protein